MEKERIINIPVHFYRNYPIDFNLDIPSEKMLGWDSKNFSLSLNNTALVVMHVWNLGLDDKLPWNAENSTISAPMLNTEWIKRYRNDIKNIEQIVSCARDNQMYICHIAAVEHYAERFQQYLSIKQQSAPAPTKSLGASIGNKWHEEWQNNIFGLNYWQQLPELHSRLDFAPTVYPKSNEGVCVTTNQFNCWLRQHGIDNLIYVGFAINMCLWFSPCGMVDMSRLNYRSFCIEEACSTVEFSETAKRLLNKQYAMWCVSTLFGYILKMAEFINSLKVQNKND